MLLINLNRGVIRIDEICSYQTERIDYNLIDAERFVSTENMLQNCEGVVNYEGVPNVDSVIKYRSGDILVSNIRPYLQKIWLADCDGGCNPDVLVIRVNDTTKFNPKYVYYALRRKAFFDHMMSGKTGVKMLRGNKVNNLRFEIPNINLDEQNQVLSEVLSIEAKISAAQKAMEECIVNKSSLIKDTLFD